MTRDGDRLCTRQAFGFGSSNQPALQRKHITPHVLRHSGTVLQSGTDVPVIRDYLGHASVATTGRDITANLQMKRDAMQAFCLEVGIEPTRTDAWKPTADLLALCSLFNRSNFMWWQRPRSTA